MAIETCLTTAGRLAFLQGRIKPTDVFKVALYTETAELGKGTKEYTKTGEVVADGYNPKQLATPTFSSNDREEAIMDFPGDIVWQNVTISATGCLIYDETLNGLAIAVGAFSSSISSTNDKFTLSPAVDLIKFL